MLEKLVVKKEKRNGQENYLKENTIISLRSAVLGPNLNYSKLIVSLQFLLFTVNDFVICSIKRNVILQMLIFIKYSLLVDRIMT